MLLEKNTVKGVNRSTDKLGIRVNKVNVCISEEMTGELGPGLMVVSVPQRALRD